MIVTETKSIYNLKFHHIIVVCTVGMLLHDLQTLKFKLEVLK